MKGTCSVEHCENPIKAKQLCAKHHTRMRRTGTTATKEQPKCAIDSCQKLSYFRNKYCKFHRDRFRQTGNALTPLKRITWCKEVGCGEYHMARGMCRKHWRLWYKRALLCRRISVALSNYCHNITTEVDNSMKDGDK